MARNKIKRLLYIRGFSLLELIMVMAIIAILLTINLNTITGQNQRQVAEQQFSILNQALHNTRRAAIITNQTVTLCPVVSNQCVNQWDMGFQAFIDSNQNTRVDSHEAVINKWSLALSNNYQLTLSWRNNNRFLRFNAVGFINAPGTFKYCIDQKGSAYSVDAIIAKSGRLRSQWFNNNRNCNE